MPSLLTPLASRVAGFGFRATMNNGEEYAQSTTTDEDLVRQTALTFFPSQQHEHLILSIDSATWRGTNASSSAAEEEPAVIVTPSAGENDMLGFKADVPAASASATPCAESTAVVALPSSIAFPSVPATTEQPAAAAMLSIPTSARPTAAATALLYVPATAKHTNAVTPDTARFFVVTITVIPSDFTMEATTGLKASLHQL